jgi:putative DNA primase/helicase
MNTFEERMDRLQKRFDEINAMSYADRDQFLSTIEPMRNGLGESSREVPSLVCEPIQPSIYHPVWEPPDEVYEWDATKGDGVYKVQGYDPMQLVAERVTNIILANKIVVAVGEDEGFMELVGDAHGIYHFNSDVGRDLSDQDFALALRDEIAITPVGEQTIGAVLLLNQKGKTQYLNMIEAVPVYRGKQVVMTKRIPIFDVDTELATWNSDKGRIEFKKAIFAKVDEEQVTQHEDDRVGCVQKATEIQVEHRVWLWPGYIGRNRLVHFGGASAEGKSPVTLDIAARASAGLSWPDGTENELGPRSVILLCAEDDWSDTVIPRLKLAGADLNNIYRFFVKQKDMEIAPSLDSDCLRLEQQIKQAGGVALVVIDPITNYLGKAKMNLEADVRGVLMPLSDVARNLDCAIITVGHLNKRDKDTAVSQRLMGAAAFGGVARDTFYFGNDPDDADKYAHVMAESRNKSVPKLKYRTESVKVEWDGKSSDVIRVKWLGVSHADIDEVVNAPKAQEKSATDKAVALITGMLRSGAKRKADIDQALKENGIDPAKLQFDRIKKRCNAKSRAIPGRGAGWEWYLETKQQHFDEIGATKQ